MLLDKFWKLCSYFSVGLIICEMKKTVIGMVWKIWYYLEDQEIKCPFNQGEHIHRLYERKDQFQLNFLKEYI